MVPSLWRTAVVLAVLAATFISAPAIANTSATPVFTEGRLPTLGPGLAASAAALEPGARLDVIVAAHEFTGLDTLDAMAVAHRRLRSAPVAFARLTEDELAQLSSNPTIRSLWPRVSYPLLLEDTTHIVGADRTQQQLGVDGQGVAVAVLDTGIDATHPDLPWHGKVIANYEVADPFVDDPLLVDVPDTDDDGHGTHVSSTVAGNDADGGHVHDGVAPGAALFGYSINIGAVIDNARALAAFDDVTQKRRAGIPIVAASNSWGGGVGGNYSPDDPLTILVKAAFEASVTVVFAAGNSGQDDGELNTATEQCVMPWAVCVGAATDPGQVVQFSSRGRPPVPTHVVMPDGDEFDVPAGNHDRNLAQVLDSGLYRPTIAAPGVNVVAACARSASTDCDSPGGYRSLSGTSMATPHASGVVALTNASRLDALGTLDLSVNQVVDVLESTANAIPGWQIWEAGLGLVDAYEAAQVVRTATPAIAPANLGAAPSPLGGGVVQLCIDDDGGRSAPACEGVAGPGGFATGVGVGEHRVEVPPGTAHLDAVLRWDIDAENLYLFVWGPGTDPDGADATRADQEAWGLLEGLGPRTQTFRHATIPYPEPGVWTMQVKGRVNTVTPYAVTPTTSTADRPAAGVTSASLDVGGTAVLEGRSSFPSADIEGTTRSAVAGTQLPLSVVGTPTQFYFHGDVPEAEKLGEFLGFAPGPTFDQEAPTSPVPLFQTGGWYGNQDFAGNFLLAYWRAPFEGTIQGDVGARLFLSSPTLSLGGIITITVFEVPTGSFGVDEAVVFARHTVSGAGIGPTPTLVEATIPNVAHTLPPGRDLIVQLGTAFVDVGYFEAWYDSVDLDAGVTLPILEGGGPTLGRPAGLTATDLTGGRVVLAWSAVDGATGYEVYRSTTPAELGRPIASVTTPTFIDTRRRPGVPVYYRVVATSSAARSEPSDAVTGYSVAATRLVEVRAGRGPWETVATGRQARRWEAVVPQATGPAADPFTFAVRARDHGGASRLAIVDFGP